MPISSCHHRQFFPRHHNQRPKLARIAQWYEALAGRLRRRRRGCSRENRWGHFYRRQLQQDWPCPHMQWRHRRQSRTALLLAGAAIVLHHTTLFAPLPQPLQLRLLPTAVLLHRHTRNWTVVATPRHRHRRGRTSCKSLSKWDLKLTKLWCAWWSAMAT